MGLADVGLETERQLRVPFLDAAHRAIGTSISRGYLRIDRRGDWDQQCDGKQREPRESWCIGFEVGRFSRHGLPLVSGEWW
jgi:hypothetical protein